MGFGGGGACEKMAIEGIHPKNIRGKGGGGQEKYFSAALKWHNVSIFKKNCHRANIVDGIQK